MNKVVFTIVSRNYLHFARTLMQSVREHAPEWKRFVLLVDECGDVLSTDEPFELVEVARLPLPQRRKFYFRYTILELNTAVKPWMFEWLFDKQQADWVTYLDPDVCLYAPPAALEALLCDGASMVLTPHLTGPLDDAHRPHEVDILKAGSYNLGFLALARGPVSERFLRWWKGKLEFNCVVDHDNGFFVDQKWLDLAPGMFDGVQILRDEGYNVAYWNLAHRHVESRAGSYSINGTPLVFYHFSGLDPKAPHELSKYQDRFAVSDLPAVATLIEDYVGRLRRNGCDGPKPAYAFANFSNGDRIPDCIRKLYRIDAAFRDAAGDDPFDLADAYLNREVGDARSAVPVTVLMQHVWNCRLDVQQAFPRIGGADRRRFAEWFVSTGADEMGIPSSCTLPIARAITAANGAGARTTRHTDASLAGESLEQLLALDDAEFVMAAYRTALGRPPDEGGLRHFLGVLRNGASKAEVLWRIRYSREGRAHPRPSRDSLRGLWPEYVRSRIRWLARGRERHAVTGRLPLQRGTTNAVDVGAHVAFGSDSARLAAPSTTLAPTVSSEWVPAPAEGHVKPPAASAPPWPAVARGRFGRASYIGFYDWGDQHAGLVWMGRTASVRLGSAPVRSVRVLGSYDATHQRQANGCDETTVAVVLNDRIVNEFSLSNSGEFDASVDVPGLTLEQPAFLTLVASNVFVPAEIGLNADPRALSLRVARIDVDDVTVLDFADAESPYRPVPQREPQNVGLNIVGYIRSEHGIGESARLCARAAGAANVPFVLRDFNAGNSARTGDDSWSARLSEDNPYAVNLFHVNADQMTLVRENLTERFFRDRYNIGFWHWELPDFPDRFQSGFAFLDEVWVPSFFVMDAVSARSPVPVVRMPHAIEFDVASGAARATFGLPNDRFLFLTMYDMHSAQGRKNPHAVIAAFRHAFANRRDAALIVKVQNTASCPDEFAELQRELGDDPRFVLIDRTLSRGQIYALEMVCDSFVSLHRSEGFGLGLAESMYLGKPVIGTNWSGNVDFMNANNSCPVDYELVTLDRDFGPYYKRGNTWADPDVEHAAWYMAKLVDDAAWRRMIGAEGARTIRTEFSPARVGRMYRQRLGTILADGSRP